MRPPRALALAAAFAVAVAAGGLGPDAARAQDASVPADGPEPPPDAPPPDAFEPPPDAFEPPTDAMGGAPDVRVMPGFVAFGTIRVGATSGAMSVGVANAGTAPLTYTLGRGGTHPGDFAVTPACATACTLQPGASQSHAVTFTPGAYGARSASLVVSSNDPDTPTVSVPLSGTGGGGILTLVIPSGGTLAFGDVPVSVTSSPQTVRVRNDGNLALRLTSASLAPAGIYAVTGALPPPDVVLAAGAIHDVAITCTPPAPGAHPASLTIGSDAVVGSPSTTVQLTCTGVVSTLAVSPSPAIFPETLVGDASQRVLTIRNTGGVAATVEQLATAPPFAIAAGPALPLILPPGGTADVTVAFAPAGDGDVNGALVVTPAIGDPLMVGLVGPGRIAAVAIDPEGDAHAFGAVCVGASAAARFRIVSSGSATIVAELPVLGAVTGPGGFALQLVDPDAGGYPASLAGGTAAVVDVVASPTAAGDATATLTLATSAGASIVALSVTGVAEGVAVSPARLDLGTVSVGATSDVHTVEVGNCDPDALAIHEVVVEGPDAAAFAVTGPLPPPTVVIAPGDAATWAVRFTPARTGGHEAELVLRHAGGEIRIPLAGRTSDVGDGPDAGVSDTTSFYACTCRGAGPAGGLPVAAALAWLVMAAARRRRRR